MLFQQIHGSVRVPLDGHAVVIRVVSLVPVLYQYGFALSRRGTLYSPESLDGPNQEVHRGLYCSMPQNSSLNIQQARRV